MRTTTKIAAAALASLALAAGAALAHPGTGMMSCGMGPGATGPAMGAPGCGPGMGPGMGHGMGHGMGYGMGPGMRHGMGPGMGPGMGMRGLGGGESAGVTAARLADLKTGLKITAAQEGAWKAYADVIQGQAQARDAMRTQMHSANATPADRAAHFEAMGKLRTEHFAARDTAWKNLLAVLSPEQKALAERGPWAMAGRPWAWQQR